jgi:hypothetical protein
VNKEILSKLKGLVSRPKEWANFNSYLEELINQQYRTMEQSDNMIAVHRAQGSIYTLRRLQKLKDEVLK